MFYAWSPTSLTAGKHNAFPAITKPQKLTTWREDSTYKEIPVPFPPAIRDGETCRLVLTAHAQGNPHIINLVSPSLGDRPFPVMSMPILFSARNAKGKAALGKQEQVERVYRVPVDVDQQVFITVREQTSFDLDKKVWDSGIGLSSWIVDLANEQSASAPPIVDAMRRALFSSEARQILELGAGTGIVSLVLGALRSAKARSESGCILTTDLASAMPLLEHNIASNDSSFTCSSTRPRAVVLDWDEERFPEEVSDIQHDFDVIIMADVTYNTSSFPSLIRTLDNIVRVGSSTAGSDPRPHHPLILLGYKERDPSERSLWDVAQNIGIRFEQVGERRGAGGEPIEIWIGTVQ